jgi:hypothetical protein
VSLRRPPARPMLRRVLGEIGTIEWCRRTNGILGRRERARFMAAVVLKAAQVTPRMLAARAGIKGSGPDPSALTPPDTPLAHDLLEACAGLEPMVVEHGYRSYLFARALGIVERLDCDDEALFAATLLHDYGFAMLDRLTDKCFTLAGAEAVAELLPEPMRHDVLDAITLHLNPTVGRERGVLQHLVHDGILVDVLGTRAWDLDRPGIRRVVEQHPRHQFVLRGEGALRAHGRRVHGCRAGALFAAGFGPALRLGPWRALEA